jgi:hypothetical protein
MFGSHVLETAVGLALIYFVVSAFASAVNEAISALLDLRAKDLEAALKNMLAQDPQPAPLAAAAAAGSAAAPAASATASQDSSLATAVLSHPMVQNLCAPNLFGKGVGNPSYLDPKVFSATLLDVLAPGSENSFAAVRESISNSKNKELRATLLPLVDRASGDLAGARANIEAWFDQAMQRLSGRYKRRSHLVLFALGLLLAIGLNLDTIRAVKTLWTAPVAREQLLEQAKKIAPSSNSSAGAAQSLPGAAVDFTAQYSAMATPLGWAEKPRPISALGWLLTAIAVSFGAPFWFDLLNKTLGLNARLSGEKPAKS